MKQVAVGISGGIDSLATVILLQEQGFTVTGIHLRLWEPSSVAREDEVESLCRRLNIPLLQVDGRALFQKRIVAPFMDSYLSGITPNPCAVCNSFVKWHLLADAAGRIGIERIATGHYVRILPHGDKLYVHKGIDPRKDQSYFLWGVPEHILQQAVTPLGNHTKTEIKEFARQQGFSRLAEKNESMGICFLENNNYRNFILRHHPATLSSPGPILLDNGEEIGIHSGVLNYTIGQKKGIPVPEGRPLYVKQILTKENTIIVAEKDSLFSRILLVTNAHFINPQEINAPDIETKIRGIGLNPSGPSRIEQTGEDSYQIRLSSPAWAAAPGQPVVFYRKDRVIGGGILCEAQY